MKRYANKRDNVEKDVVEVLRQCGFSIYYLDQPVDLLAGRRSETHLVEIKDPAKQGRKHEYTSAQRGFMEEWRGSPVVTLRSVQDAIEWSNGRSQENG